MRLHVTTIPKGSAVMLLGASADREAGALSDADAFDADRDEAPTSPSGADPIAIWVLR